MKYTKQIIALMAIAISSFTFAQDGEGLFKSKCNTCHMLGKNSTGPNLKGVKAKWEEAGEGELIYEWVNNPQTLIASGKSTVAMKSKDFSPTDMTPQSVSKEEIDAILDFVDNWEPVVETTPPPTEGGKQIVYVTNYKKNLTMFYFLIALLIVQIGGILVLGNSLTTIVKSELIKKKNEMGGAAKAILVLVGMFGLIALNNSTLALTFMEAGEAGENMPWLLIEDTDIYFMVALNVLALGILLYMRKSFMEMFRVLHPASFEKRASRRRKSVNKILTDVVPIEEEASILMHHEYDGIRELDNNLPPWWVWGFYFTIGFAVVYMINYHILGTSDLQIEAYNKDMKRAEKEVAAYLDKMAMNVDETTATLMTDSKDLSAGKTIFNANCASCHKENGEGEVGPNLTDKYWIYGYDIKEVFGTINNGTTAGMPAHSDKLNPIQVQQVASYVLSMPEAKGQRGPDGEIVEK